MWVSCIFLSSAVASLQLSSYPRNAPVVVLARPWPHGGLFEALGTVTEGAIIGVPLAGRCSPAR